MKLKEMGKSRIIMGKFNTFYSIIAQIKKLSIKDVNSPQIDINQCTAKQFTAVLLWNLRSF